MSAYAMPCILSEKSEVFMLVLCDSLPCWRSQCFVICPLPVLFLGDGADI